MCRDIKVVPVIYRLVTAPSRLAPVMLVSIVETAKGQECQDYSLESTIPRVRYYKGPVSFYFVICIPHVSSFITLLANVHQHCAGIFKLLNNSYNSYRHNLIQKQTFETPPLSSNFHNNDSL
jgi:hypothetical protein